MHYSGGWELQPGIRGHIAVYLCAVMVRIGHGNLSCSFLFEARRDFKG